MLLLLWRLSFFFSLLPPTNQILEISFIGNWIGTWGVACFVPVRWNLLVISFALGLCPLFPKSGRPSVTFNTIPQPDNLHDLLSTWRVISFQEGLHGPVLMLVVVVIWSCQNERNSRIFLNKHSTATSVAHKCFLSLYTMNGPLKELAGFVKF